MALFRKLAMSAVLLLECSILAQDAAKKPGQDVIAAQPLSRQSEQEQYRFTTRSNLVFLPTRVEDKNGQTIYGLKPEQFIVEDNGIRQQVQIEEDPEGTPGLSLVVAIQCSRSAGGEFNKFRGLSTMIDEIVGEAPHEVAIISYGEAIYTLGGFTGSSDAVSSALSKLKFCGRYSAISIDAVEYAIGMLKRRQNRFRRAILLISEGRDHGSHAKIQDAVAELGITDTVIYSLTFSPAKDDVIRFMGLGGPEAAPPADSKHSSEAKTKAESSSAGTAQPREEEPVYLVHPPPLVLPPGFTSIINALRRSTSPELASLSGGEYIPFTTRKGFEEGLQHISNQIRNYYLLSFKPALTPAFGLHSLRVRIPDYPDAVILTRKSYWSGVSEAPSAADPHKE